ncbi:sugar kinase [Enterococcus sp. LJL98]
MKIGAYGEVMLRMNPPEYLTLEQTDTVRLMYTGTGVNILGNLAHFEIDSFLLTALPENRLGDAAMAKLRSFGIQTTYTLQEGQHLGSYFAEMGYGPRPTEVTYQNRLNSSFCLTAKESYDLSAFVTEMDVIHICGINLSLTKQTVETALTLAKKAHEAGKKVCFDFNFRPSLNQELGKKEEMRAQYEQILPYCTLVFGSLRDLTELLGWKQGEESEIALIQAFLKHYDIEWFAGTTRSQVGHQKQLSGYLVTQTSATETAPYPLEILDRIGAGDGYAAGVLLGFAENWPIEKTVAFSLANARLAHTIQGDTPLTNRRQVEQLLNHPTTDLVR